MWLGCTASELFAGEQLDATQNNYYLRARYYNQQVGRFTQQDTWMGNNHDPITLHKYLYANADPANFIDPTGNFSLGSFSAASTINGILTTVSIVQTSVSLFDFVTGNEEISARQLGSEILLGLLTRGLGNNVNKIKNLIPKRFRDQIQNCFGNSFTKGTLVTTRNGLIPIENIHIGDEVLSLNMDVGKAEYQKVIHLIQNKKEYDIYSIQLSSLDGEVIEATERHPIFVNGKWMDASEIIKGDVLTVADGGVLKVDGVSSNRIETSVYNLTIDGNHNYFVGNSQVLVHNTNFLCQFGKVRLERPLRTNDMGVSGQIRVLRGNFALQDSKAIYQIDYIESSTGKLDYFTILEHMKKQARSKGATTLRIEATIGEETGRLLRLLNRRLGSAQSGSGRFQDVWEIPL